MYRQRCHSRALLIARNFLSRAVLSAALRTLCRDSLRFSPVNGRVYPFALKCALAGRNDTVAIAAGSHLFPFRTEKLSPCTPMVLRKRESRSPPPYRGFPPGATALGGNFFFVPGTGSNSYIGLSLGSVENSLDGNLNSCDVFHSSCD